MFVVWIIIAAILFYGCLYTDKKRKQLQTADPKMSDIMLVGTAICVLLCGLSIGAAIIS